MVFSKNSVREIFVISVTKRLRHVKFGVKEGRY